MINLLFFLPSYVFGGAERTSLNLLNGIDKKRFLISLVTSRNLFPHFRHIEIDRFIPVEDTGIDVWFKKPDRFISDTGRAASLLKAEKPDIAFGMMHYPSALLVFAKKFFNINCRVVVSPRGPSVEYLRYFEKKILRKLYLKFVFSFFCRYADGIIVASQGMKEECVRHFHAKEQKVNLTPNSVNISEISVRSQEPAEVSVPPGFRMLSVSGRLETEKNISFLLKAFSEIRKHEKTKLLVIGDGTEKNNLEKLSQELNIRDDVIFTGYQNNPYKFISLSDIYIHTCFFEGFANSIIEAMACSVPVISMDCPYGPGSIIKHGRNGLLVPMNNEKAMVSAVLELLRDNKLRSEISRNGFERAHDFSVEAMVSGYSDFFEKVAGGLI